MISGYYFSSYTMMLRKSAARKMQCSEIWPLQTIWKTLLWNNGQPCAVACPYMHALKFLHQRRSVDTFRSAVAKPHGNAWHNMAPELYIAMPQQKQMPQFHLCHTNALGPLHIAGLVSV